MSGKKQVKPCGKNFEIIFADSTNFKAVKEDVKQFSEKTKTNLWYRIENTETETNCICFIAVRGFKVFELTISRPINFNHFVVYKKTQTAIK